MSVTQHKQDAPNQVNVMILTVSDTRDETTDKSGNKIRELVKKSGHTVVLHKIVKDEKTELLNALLEGCNCEKVDVILTNGGTGIASRDITIEIVEELLDKRIPGYGEIFRILSYETIGSAAILSRAIAGIANKTAIFSMPGSLGAVQLAMEKLILPELTHVVGEVRRLQS
ncbi:MAG: molybdenum cofactor biosynthesis protein B [Bacillus sp. (in: firmicutes)]